MSTNKPRDFWILLPAISQKDSAFTEGTYLATSVPLPEDMKRKYPKGFIHVREVLPQPETPEEIIATVNVEAILRTGYSEREKKIFSDGASYAGPLYAAHAARVCLEILKQERAEYPSTDYENELSTCIHLLEQKLKEKGIL